MWPYGNPMIPAFENAKRVAANMPPNGERGNYTPALFAQDFPQFYTKAAPGSEPVVGVGTVGIMTIGGAQKEPLLPAPMLEQFVDLANSSVIPSIWAAQWRYAAGLFVAHWAALYLKTYSDGSPSAASVASRAGSVGQIASAQLGDTSITYDNGAVDAGTEKWGAWNATIYGTQLATMARMVGIGGVYVI
ncbi:MAG: DUF4054 domain-containing protein [Oscillospiraceae bacterium]|nr:DUF4054 domain-containing protein [Oscillospiraceae bacterium]